MSRLWRWLRLLLGLILIAALIPIFAQPEFWQTLAHVNVPLVVAATVLSAISVVSKAWRWGAVMRWRGLPQSSSYLVSGYFIGMFFNNFLPSGLGGDVVRAYQTARDTGRGAESVISVVIERGSGMVSLFAAGSVGALFVPLPLSITLLAHGLFLGSLVGLWALWSDVTGRILRVVGSWLPNILQSPWSKITRLYEEFRGYRREWRLFATVMAQSLVTLITTLASVYLLLLAFDNHVSFGGFAAVYSIVTAIDVIPFSLNGLGIREGTYVYFLGLLGVPSAIALGVALLVRLIVALFALFGGLLFLWQGSVKKLQK
ncbi:MAG: flippase-like domain-containing protein [Anaerolineae bacterium]|nr:flippase-like domain-containing protein [Anaerolineae bacterium]